MEDLLFIFNSEKMRADFKRFTVNIFLFFVFLYLLDLGVGYIFGKIKDLDLRCNPENTWTKTPFVIEKVNSDVVIIGSSKASHHYIPGMISDSLKLTAYNCGQDGCFFLYQNCVINMLLDRYTPKMIVWDIQPSSFIRKNSNEEYQNFRYLSPYYRTNKWVKIYIDGESTKMPYRMQSKMFSYNSKALNYIYPLISGASATDYGYIPLPNDGYSYPIKYIGENKPYSQNKEYLTLLYATLKRCKEAGVIVELFVSPEYSVETSEYAAAIEDISKVANVHLAAFHNMHSFADSDSTFFKDVNHLNDKGARVYTAAVIEDIKN